MDPHGIEYHAGVTKLMRIYYAANMKKFQLHTKLLNTKNTKVKHNKFPSFHLCKQVCMTDTHAHMNLNMENKSGKGD